MSADIAPPADQEPGVGARVRSHTMALAHRQTRECLRRDTRDLLARREGS